MDVLRARFGIFSLRPLLASFVFHYLFVGASCGRRFHKISYFITQIQAKRSHNLVLKMMK